MLLNYRLVQLLCSVKTALLEVITNNYRAPHSLRIGLNDKTSNEYFSSGVNIYICIFSLFRNVYILYPNCITRRCQTLTSSPTHKAVIYKPSLNTWWHQLYKHRFQMKKRKKGFPIWFYTSWLLMALVEKLLSLTDLHIFCHWRD